MTMDNGSYLIFMLGLVVVFEVFSVTKSEKGWTDNSIKIIGLTVVSFLSVIAALVVPEGSKEALTGVYGILGGIAGYLFGKSAK